MLKSSYLLGHIILYSKDYFAVNGKNSLMKNNSYVYLISLIILYIIFRTNDFNRLDFSTILAK